jgi:alpha-galactosidase
MPVFYDQDTKIFVLETRNTSYIIGINQAGGVQSLHWGEKVNHTDCVNMLKPHSHSSFDPNIEKEKEECCPWGGLFYAEPSIKAVFFDGVRDLKMTYETHTINKSPDELIVTMKDEYYNMEVDLVYRIIEEFDLIERHCIIRNTGEDSFLMENAGSAVWNIPNPDNSKLTYVSGKWAGESQLRQYSLTEGKFVLESRKGFTSPNFNPWFALSNEAADEEYGTVWFGVLAWSGNWKITVEKTSFGNVRVVGGINDFDFGWEMLKGAAFETPVFVGGYSNQGYGEMSRKLHEYQRKYILPKEHADKPRKVLYNSWEATGFNVNAEEQMVLAEKAAKLGVELYVIDDGWFGTRNNDQSGLGDWHVNKNKFPEGLTPLIKKVNALGMDFGIWVEPEMVNPDSELFRAHPDWVYGFPTRIGSLGRNQLVLNLSKDEVKDFILDFMSDLLANNNIKFIKWDMNRPVSEPGWMEVPEKRRKEIWVRHIINLYAIWSKLKSMFPEVVFESCAGGGGRIDLGMMRYADQFWASDNTDAFDRLSIQEGYSYAYCSKAMMCWVTDPINYLNHRKLPIRYRFLSAMMGSLGIGGNLNEWSDEDLGEAGRMVGLYKEIRHIVQEGKQYRLSSPGSGKAAVQYTDDKMNESVVFVLGHSQQFAESPFRIYLKGLAPERTYLVECEGEEVLRMSGGGLKNVGLPIALKGDFGSKIIRIKAVD